MKSTTIFSNSKRKLPSSFYMTMAVVLAFIFFCLLISLNFEFSKLKGVFSQGAIKSWIGIFVGFLTSVLSTIFYEFYVKQENERNNFRTLMSLADPDLIADVFATLEGYWKKYYSSYKIECTMSKHHHKGFINMNVKYTIHKALSSSNVYFQFTRITNEAERAEAESIGKGGHNYEFFEVLDETDFSVNDRILDVDYKISNLLLTIDKISRTIILQRNMQSNKIIYSGLIPKDIFEMGKEAEFEFDATFPLEIDSFHDFAIDLPTKNLDCTIKYENVNESIYITGAYFISSKSGPNIVKRGENDTFRYICNDWTLPKSALVFTWWNKK